MTQQIPPNSQTESLRRPTAGCVYLVGAGPGEPRMITLRGVECLKMADVVLYDYLVNPRILDHATSGARLVCLGKHGQGRIMSQDKINQKIIEEALAGQQVVRLKGGDPALFARGAEEVEALASAGVRFEIVPGVTAALAAGSFAGIPITHRDFASAVALVTAQEQPEKAATNLDYQALAQFPGTLVFYMGVTTAKIWTSALLSAGKSPECPSAIVRRCSLPDQQTILCTLGTVAEQIEQQQIRPPAIVIIGEVVHLESTMSWFKERPLFGQQILVTRAEDQSGPLCDRLSDLGAEVVRQAAIDISPPDDWTHVDDAIGRLSSFDWLVFSSSNGVRFLLDRLIELGHDVRKLAGLHLAAIGPATKKTLAEYHLRCDITPTEYRAEALVEALRAGAAGKKFLLARASRGREVLSEGLAQAGGSVEQMIVYRSTDVAAAEPSIVSLLEAGQIDWITVTSSAIARSLVAMFGESLRKSKLACISPITSETLRDLGFEPGCEATSYTMEGQIEAILAAIAAD